jgi:hypothetical protein
MIRQPFLQHNLPHFHAKYGNQKVIIEIESGIVKGEMSERALRLIFEWLDLHRTELKQAWYKAKYGVQQNKIEPLK